MKTLKPKLSFLYKYLFMVLMVWLLNNISSAQELGVRVGKATAASFAIDGVYELDKSRIHADLYTDAGFFANGFGVDALYDFIYKIVNRENFAYYGGVGGGAWIGDKFDMAINAELGIEYRFYGVPVILGADWRPSLWFLNETEFKWDGFGVNLRYRF